MKKWVILLLILCLSMNICDGRDRYDFQNDVSGVFVASDTATHNDKRIADFVCDGTDDDVQINAAIQGMTGGKVGSIGGYLYLSEGEFSISSPISIDRGINFQGVSGGVTILKLAAAANCNVINLALIDEGNDMPLSILEGFEINGNKANQGTQPDRTYTGKSFALTGGVTKIDMGAATLTDMVLTGRKVATRYVVTIDITGAADPVTYDHATKTITATGGTPFADIAADDLVRITSVTGTTYYIPVASKTDTTIVLDASYGTAYDGDTCTAVEIRVNHGYSTIASHDTQYLTLDEDISPTWGDVTSNCEVEIDQLYGIYQAFGESHIDTRFNDIWFESIQGHGISLGAYWNHCINKCTFEHLDGYAIEFRLGASTDAMIGIDIFDCFTMDNFGFTKVGGFAGNGADVVELHDNRILGGNQAANKDIIEVAGGRWKINNNTITYHVDTDNVYSIVKMDLDRLGADTDYLGFTKNMVQYAGANSKFLKYVVHIIGESFTPAYLTISDNDLNAANHQNTGIYIENRLDYANYNMIKSNMLYGRTNADGINIESCYYTNVQGNLIRCQGSGNAIEVNASYKWQRSIITGNIIELSTGKVVNGTVADGSNGVYIASNQTSGKYSGAYERGGDGAEADIASGSTSVVVTHGLNTTPDIYRDVMVWPCTSLGAASFWWVSAATSTTFTINLNADPEATVSFGWRVHIYCPYT